MKRIKINERAWLLLLALFPAAIVAQTIPAQNNDTLRKARHEFSIQQAVDYANKNNVQVKLPSLLGNAISI